MLFGILFAVLTTSAVNNTVNPQVPEQPAAKRAQQTLDAYVAEKGKLQLTNKHEAKRIVVRDGETWIE